MRETLILEIVKQDDIWAIELNERGDLIIIKTSQFQWIQQFIDLSHDHHFMASCSLSPKVFLGTHRESLSGAYD